MFARVRFPSRVAKAKNDFRRAPRGRGRHTADNAAQRPRPACPRSSHAPSSFPSPSAYRIPLPDERLNVNIELEICLRSKNKTKNRLVKPLDICISFYAQSSVTREVPARACRPARAAAGGHAPCPKPCPCRRAAAVMRQDVMPSWLMRQQFKKKQKLGGLRWRCPLRPAPLVRRRASRLERSMIVDSYFRLQLLTGGASSIRDRVQTDPL